MLLFATHAVLFEMTLLDEAGPALCPCQSGDPYAACCEPIHAGQPATSAAALMRSRYSAFAVGRHDHLLATWHPSTRPQELAPEPDTRWCGLTIHDETTTGETAEVVFEATWQDNVGFAVLKERSRFVQEAGRWFYVDGEADQRRLKPARNTPCPCGSGRKYKACCRA